MPRAGQTAAGGMPATLPQPHNLFLAALPFAVVIVVAIADVMAEKKAALWINHDKPQSDTQRHSPQYYD